MDSPTLVPFLQPLLTLQQNITTTIQAITTLPATFNMISLNVNDQDPYDTLTGAQHTEVFDFHTALENYQNDIDALLDAQQRPWVKETTYTALQPLRQDVMAGLARLEPIVVHPSAFAKMVRFELGFEEVEVEVEVEGEEVWKGVEFSGWG